MATQAIVNGTELFVLLLYFSIQGNIFAIRKGKRAGAPTCVGSHMDTQPTGGRYVWGTLCGSSVNNCVLTSNRMESWVSVLGMC